MSSPSLRRTADRLTGAMVKAAWAQWAGIDGWASGAPSRSIVDPEALVLASLWLDTVEPRLWRVMRAWSQGGSRFLSVQRIKNLSPHYPARVALRLSEFAWQCVTEAKDARWRGLARQPAVAPKRDRELVPSPRFQTPAALVLRLRIGLGVGIKADVLAYLLGSAGSSRTLREMTAATGYMRRAVDRAADELVTAGFVTSLATAPASYRAPVSAWEPLLHLGASPPYWWHWDLLFRFAAALDDVATATAGQSAFLQASAARDLVETHYPAFDLNSLPVREVTAAVGADYLRVLAEDVEELAGRVERNFV